MKLYYYGVEVQIENAHKFLQEPEDGLLYDYYVRIVDLENSENNSVTCGLCLGATFYATGNQLVVGQ